MNPKPASEGSKRECRRTHRINEWRPGRERAVGKNLINDTHLLAPDVWLQALAAKPVCVPLVALVDLVIKISNILL